MDYNNSMGGETVAIYYKIMDELDKFFETSWYVPVCILLIVIIGSYAYSYMKGYEKGRKDEKKTLYN
jgi:hypothetical protein